MQTKRNIETYPDLAQWYDTHYQANGTWKTSADYAQRLYELLEGAGCDRTETKSLLDVACGGGFFLGHIGKYFQFTCGCDISHVALQEARVNRHLTNLCLANGEHLPFRDRSVDVVSCLGSLEHFLNIDRALAEFRRVLRPQGVVLILVPTNPAWAVYDIQPTEVVLGEEGWKELFRTSGFQTVVTKDTDSDEVLKASSGGCQVYYLRLSDFT